MGAARVALVGYARVSTAEQNLDLQKNALAKAGCEDVFKDQASGAKAERPGLARALGHVRRGDTLVVWKLDRLGRSMAHLIETVRKLEAKRVVSQFETGQALDRHARTCSGHPRRRRAVAVRLEDVDGRVKPGHDGQG